MPTEASERVKRWRQNNPGKRNAYERKRHADDEAHRARVNDANKRSYQKHLEKQRLRSRTKQAKYRALNPVDPAEDRARRRRNHLRRRYGLTPEQKEELFVSQDKQCAICGNPSPTRWAIDHCHKTGRVRGILCQSCNTGVGLFADNTERLKAAIKYLKAQER